MKSLFKISAMVLSLALCISFASFNFAEADNHKEEVVGVSFTIKNDTRDNVRLYDSKGHYTLNRGYSKKVNVDAGRKYYESDKGRKGDFLFEVDSDFAGETIKLSDYM